MAFSKDALNANEKVILDLRPHWSYFVREVGAVVLVLVLIVVALVFSAPSWLVLVTLAIMVAALLWLGRRYWEWTTTNFVVTTDRIITRNGMLSRHGVEIPLERINTVFFNQTLIERMIGSGDLVIESAGEMGTSRFSDVRKPLRVQNEIYKQMEDNENRKFDRAGQNAAIASIPEQIDQLDELRRRGVLTDAEFEAKKTQLLDRL